MADEKKPEDSQNLPKPGDNSADNPGSTADAHWQKIADQRLVENERLAKELEEAKKKSASSDELTDLRTRLKEIETNKERERLEKDYPDIEPDLLLGKTPEEQQDISTRQRQRVKEFTANSIDVNAPQYSQSDIDTQIDTIKKSTKNPIQQAQEVLRLNRLRNGQGD